MSKQKVKTVGKILLVVGIVIFIISIVLFVMGFTGFGDTASSSFDFAEPGNSISDQFDFAQSGINNFQQTAKKANKHFTYLLFKYAIHQNCHNHKVVDKSTS